MGIQAPEKKIGTWNLHAGRFARIRSMAARAHEDQRHDFVISPGVRDLSWRLSQNCGLSIFLSLPWPMLSVRDCFLENNGSSPAMVWPWGISLHVSVNFYDLGESRLKIEESCDSSWLFSSNESSFSLSQPLISDQKKAMSGPFRRDYFAPVRMSIDSTEAPWNRGTKCMKR